MTDICTCRECGHIAAASCRRNECACCIDNIGAHFVKDDRPTLPKETKSEKVARDRADQSLLSRCVKDKMFSVVMMCVVGFVVAMGILHGLGVINWAASAWTFGSTSVTWGTMFVTGAYFIRRAIRAAGGKPELRMLRNLTVVFIVVMIVVLMSVHLRFMTADFFGRSEFTYAMNWCCYNDDPRPAEIPIREALNVMWVVSAWLAGGVAMTVGVAIYLGARRGDF